ncbi:MAG: hypothetical protein ACXW15_03530 [Acidimicrobiia bacterium]|jgi:hypothetical protein
MSNGPHPRHVINNWRTSDLPFLEKLALAVKNNAIKMKNRSDCCGNHGEPGC